MRYNIHSDLEGKHAFLSASNYSWLNYDDEKFDLTYKTRLAAMRGSQLHQLAADLIALGVKLPASRKTLNMYVNDAIGFRMDTEKVLAYSKNAFGTADAIRFHQRKNELSNSRLRIHDLKTGITPASMTQLVIYAAFFCLEYGMDPLDRMEFELRIYQNDEVVVYEPEPDEVIHVISMIRHRDRRIEEMKAEAFE